MASKGYKVGWAELAEAQHGVASKARVVGLGSPTYAFVIVTLWVFLPYLLCASVAKKRFFLPWYFFVAFVAKPYGRAKPFQPIYQSTKRRSPLSSGVSGEKPTASRNRLVSA